ncbi:oligosaccharyl transferas-like protein subunit [Viridothelium virens]|uniref:Oligosaccharyl transferas-like protein subunit n=1 Tax=Viridothelium virens TaxID=1048519 RepID=A0A6A6HIQ2_VIRVR|nr:oligosaccharyl transferas-like protein subunit [Viridothelium virens]
MRFFQTLTALLLPVAALGAKKSTGDRFKENFGKQISSAPLKLDDDLYKQLTTAPRDYSVAVLLTALEARFGCQLCRDFQPEWEILARSWTKGDKKGDSRLLFGTLDFNDGKATFQSLMLQTAPVLLLFQPTTGPNAKADAQPVRFDFNTGVSDAHPIHSWIARHLPDAPHPPLVRPINYTRIVVVTTSVLGIITFASVAWPYVMPVAQNRNLWAALSLIAVLLFTSGHMFNHIRKVPYVAADGRGGITYFAGGFQNQFGMETQLVGAMYGVLAFATISLALRVPRMTNPQTQAVAVAVWGGVMFGMYSFLLSVFRIKNGGYPFYLPPF